MTTNDASSADVDTAGAGHTASDVGAPPRTLAAARPTLVVAGIVLLAAAGGCGFELFRVLRDESTAPTTNFIAGAPNTLSQASWLPILGGVALAVGIVSLLLALSPTRISHYRFASDLWLSPTTLARLCSERARRVPGVHFAVTAFGPRTVRITVYASGRRPAELTESVRAEVEPLLAQLATPRQLKLRFREEGKK